MFLLIILESPSDIQQNFIVPLSALLPHDPARHLPVFSTNFHSIFLLSSSVNSRLKPSLIFVLSFIVWTPSLLTGWLSFRDDVPRSRRGPLTIDIVGEAHFRSHLCPQFWQLYSQSPVGGLDGSGRYSQKQSAFSVVRSRGSCSVKGSGAQCRPLCPSGFWRLGGPNALQNIRSSCWLVTPYCFIFLFGDRCPQ